MANRLGPLFVSNYKFSFSNLFSLLYKLLFSLILHISNFPPKFTLPCQFFKFQIYSFSLLIVFLSISEDSKFSFVPIKIKKISWDINLSHLGEAETRIRWVWKRKMITRGREILMVHEYFSHTKWIFAWKCYTTSLCIHYWGPFFPLYLVSEVWLLNFNISFLFIFIKIAWLVSYNFCSSHLYIIKKYTL